MGPNKAIKMPRSPKFYTASTANNWFLSVVRVPKNGIVTPAAGASSLASSTLPEFPK